SLLGGINYCLKYPCHSGFEFCQYDPANGEDAALVARAAGPVAWPAGPQRDQTDAAQQEIGDGQDQQQPIDAIRTRHAGITQAPAVAFVLLIAKQLLDG